ncbi:recombination regulator RecX [Corynebacterium doosanense]|uniref:Regulatory protein RecX n=1 Tax=Corynebacterium doosanense CAU 212 = DSM 45436 TaxID=558173 RepID=A0A097IGM2_9CORY|nr:recombination regulator RecX [Corynebacterium doosanense]AIT61303.1 recombinase RecX [Corynebacterium doosanense CAU 212 = DSM 45436]
MTSNTDKVERLRQELENFSGGTLFDHEAEEAKAQVRGRALRLLDQRARSRHELRGRLVDLDFDPRLIDEVLDDLERAQLLDDQSFAHEWVRQRHARRGKSASVLDRELREKGVSEAIRTEALEQIDSSDEESAARSAAEKKARTVKTVPADRAERDKLLRRILGVLARRGYGGEMSMRIARAALDDRIAELEQS